jgi:hypothetical protein
MIARGGVFAELRSRMLSAFPNGTQALFHAEATLGDWIETGTFTVKSCSKRYVELNGSEIDFANRAMLEVENLTNHCFEHVRELICFRTDASHRSDAWAAVTAYYLGFFSAAALLRLIGSPIAFVNRQQLQILQTLAGSARAPNPGALKFELGQSVSVTHREIRLVPAEKIHEATWKTALQIIDQLNRDPKVSKHPDEADFYDSLCTSAFRFPGIGFDWPSYVRVRANYRPGHAYKLRANHIGVVRTIEYWRKADAADVFSVVRSAHVRCAADTSALTNQVTMMMNVSFAVFLIVRALYQELLLRRPIDRRWEKARAQYRDRFPAHRNDFKALATCY